jgi:hypothetical protein
MTPAERTKLDRWKAELAASFTVRRCKFCGAPATVVVPGDLAVREMGIVLKRAKPDRNLCGFHAGLMSNQEAA